MSKPTRQIGLAPSRSAKYIARRPELVPVEANKSRSYFFIVLGEAVNRLPLNSGNPLFASHHASSQAIKASAQGANFQESFTTTNLARLRISSRGAVTALGPDATTTAAWPDHGPINHAPVSRRRSARLEVCGSSHPPTRWRSSCPAARSCHLQSLAPQSQQQSNHPQA